MKKQFYTFVILIILFVVSTFYWFNIRPSDIRKTCINYSMADAANQEIFWNNYKFCLASKGLKE
ncbi:MAG: hypothetical protein WCV73_02320 [Patescibacteria group bacterium]|jgi:hypothetical protein